MITLVALVILAGVFAALGLLIVLAAARADAMSRHLSRSRDEGFREAFGDWPNVPSPEPATHSLEPRNDD